MHNSGKFTSAAPSIFASFYLRNYCVGILFTIRYSDNRCSRRNLYKSVFHLYQFLFRKIKTAGKHTYGYYSLKIVIIQVSKQTSVESFLMKKIACFKHRFKLSYVTACVTHYQPEPHYHKRYIVKQCLFK